MLNAKVNQSSLRGMRVGILGGGITGLTAAFYLLRAGAQVTVIEAREQVGGLATYFDFGPFSWDKFYHCILTSDKPLLQLIEDLGMSEELRWTQTKVGFFTDGQLHSMSTTLDFLRFPPLSLWQKFRLGLGVMYASRIRDGRSLEALPVTDWLVKVFGQANYDKMWAPLLKCKLGACSKEASAAFIWATIFRLYSTRDRSAGHKECLGYVRGGYRTVILRLLEEIKQRGGQIVTGLPVERIEGRPSGGCELFTAQGRLSFDRILATAPSRTVASMVPQLSQGYLEKLRSIKYLGVVCVALVLKRKLSPYYVTNLTENGFPFTGIIEMSNLISSEETDGRHLVYLPKYTAPGDSLFEASNEEIWSLFLPALKRVFPDLQESEIERHFVFREKLVQPVPVLNYSRLVPEMETNVPGLFLANTTQIINSTLNNNEMVKIAKRAVETILHSQMSLAFAPQGEVNAYSGQLAAGARFVRGSV